MQNHLPRSEFASKDDDWLPRNVVEAVLQTDAATASDASAGEGKSNSKSEESESEPEGSASGMAAEPVSENATEYIAKDETAWSKEPPEIRQVASQCSSAKKRPGQINRNSFGMRYFQKNRVGRKD
ncbi:hypothetical protein HHI36_007605 [Cryptolaemus montrouzieri]|uniref:Uncharacterized protein n=1 Tax=Cryptolaemus montrouzieri TaxID=559131 RepID=A0ABD2MQ08_9CUCU